MRCGLLADPRPCRPLRRFVELEMRGESGRLLFAGNALHADLTPETAGSALFGWMPWREPLSLESPGST